MLFSFLFCLYITCMRIYDVSVPISERMPTYEGDPGVEIKEWATIAGGDAANVTVLHFGAHTGTHVDAPAHFIEGASKVSEMPLDVLIGEARVVSIPEDARSITAAHVAAQDLGDATRVLFRTRNSDFWSNPEGAFRADFTYLEPEAARALVLMGVRLVGIDYLSVEKFKPERFETHQALLSNSVVIIEGLDLRAVAPGVYELICLPLKIASGTGDGAPARAVLRSLE
jgi:arylformamidase